MTKEAVIDEITARRVSISASLQGSSNFEGKKGRELLQKSLAEMEEQFDAAIDRILDPSLADEDKIDWDDPFMAASRRATQRWKIAQPELPPDIDESEAARRRMYAEHADDMEIDQAGFVS